jgi:glycosidase
VQSLNLDRGDTLSALVQVYRYWIALTDCDGFRLDTVKHVPLAAAQRFCQGA